MGTNKSTSEEAPRVETTLRGLRYGRAIYFYPPFASLYGAACYSSLSPSFTSE